jgi:hypothetical protein
LNKRIHFKIYNNRQICHTFDSFIEICRKNHRSMGRLNQISINVFDPEWLPRPLRCLFPRTFIFWHLTCNSWFLAAGEDWTTAVQFLLVGFEREVGTRVPVERGSATRQAGMGDSP